MKDNEDETAKDLISVLSLKGKTQEVTDGNEVTATMKSLALLLHQIVLEKKEATPSSLTYLTKHVGDLLQFAKTTATTIKLQSILEKLHHANRALEQGEDAASLLRDAWQLMRNVLSHDEVEKIATIQIEFRRSGMDSLLISGIDEWEQANRILQKWSTLENEDQRVEYVVSYSDGFQDGRWFKLPLFYASYNGVRF